MQRTAITLEKTKLKIHGHSSTKAKNMSEHSQDGDIVQTISKDSLQNLKFPMNGSPRDISVMPSAEYERIASMSRVLQREERESLAEACQREKEEKTKTIENTKHQIMKADLSHRRKKGLTEMEIKSRDHAQNLIKQASSTKIEQEEDIRRLNMLILDAQCQATRDAQIKENKQIQTELSEEEKRLDNMMEVGRCKALEKMELTDGLHKQQRIRGMQQIYHQIIQHLEDKQLLKEMKEQKKLQIRDNQEKMNLEDQKALDKKRREQRRLLEEIMHVNSETIRAMEQRRDEEKLTDLRDLKYTQNKLEREAKYEAEQEYIRTQKKMEIARMRAKQQRANVHKAEQDEIRSRRNQEVADREWRRKEKNMAVKKKQEEVMLRMARLEQVQCKERFLSFEAGMEKAEAEQELEFQHKAIIKQKEEEERHRQNARCHAKAIQHQIKEQELFAIAKQREIFKEAECLVEEAHQRRMRLDELKKKKLHDLKAVGLSDKYCSKVQRKAWVC